jgi:menaquinone-dependent protoporphyrinogen oxidase
MREEQAMNKKILVAFASKNGSTREIAEKIGEVLNQANWQTTVLPVNGSVNLDEYSAVVMGSAVYIGKWQKEAATFLRTQEKFLAGLPVWLFSSGPTGEGDAVGLLEGWRMPADLQPVIDRIHPRDIAVFHGYINPQKLNFIEKQVIKSMNKPFGDFRDWDAITGWTAKIANDLISSN